MADEAVPFGGPKALESAIAKGKDPNADLKMKSDDSATKAEAALSLKLSGASYTNIAKILGYSSAFRARQAVEQVLANAADSVEDRDKMRVLISRRLDRLLQSVMGKAVDPKSPDHLAYNARALAIVDRQAKLAGVDAPTQIQISASDEQIEAYIARVRPLAQADMDAEESDLIDEGEVG